MASSEVRVVETQEEFLGCENLQQLVWGKLSIASEALIAVQKSGGLVIGYFLARKVVGCLVALLGQRNRHVIHWSHMMAVAPDYRDRGFGFQMKLAHRKLALERGIRSICWTYDPLQTRNATLNISRLGAKPEEYCIDCYGNFATIIEKGLPSDRFVVNWKIASYPVRRRLRGGRPPFRPQELPLINLTKVNRGGFLENNKILLALREKVLAFEVPANTDGMRRMNFQLARQWRLDTRKILTSYLAVGYCVEDFVPPSGATGMRTFYILKKGRHHAGGASFRKQGIS